MKNQHENGKLPKNQRNKHPEEIPLFGEFHKIIKYAKIVQLAMVEKSSQNKNSTYNRDVRTK